MLSQMLKRKKIKASKKFNVIVENNVDKLMFRKLIATKQLRLHGNYILQAIKYHK